MAPILCYTIFKTKLQKAESYAYESQGSTKAAIVSTQRNMFIIVSICTVTQMLKAINQVIYIELLPFRIILAFVDRNSSPFQEK